MRKIFRRITITALSVITIGNIQAQTTGFEIIKGIDLIENVFENLDKYFVDEPKFGDMSKTAIDAMLKQLDPYTVYYHESNMEDYLLMTTGQYGGIGAVIRKMGDYTFIIEPYKDKPAYKAGLRAGDKILKIDGHDMKKILSDDVSKSLKGSAGSEITIDYERNGEKKSATFKREEIEIPVIPYYGMLDNQIGYISLNTFMKQTVTSDVADAIKDLKAKGMKKLVMDLRGNGGGFLNQAVSLVNLFVDAGISVVKTKGRLESEQFDYKTQTQPLDKDIPLVVLVDENSASASEIFSGTLQDLDRAVIVGRTSFGKGLVQRTYDLRYGAKMKLTVAKYYTNSGRCVQKLEYYDKSYGKKADEIPDSLIKTFYTKNGRPVIDGRGVEPDVKVERDEYSLLSKDLLIHNLIFEYANQFYYKNSSIAPVNEFELSDADYADFKKLVVKDTFDYKTESEDLLLKLKKVAEDEKTFDDVKDLYDKMLTQLTPSKERDLEKFKTEIKELLEDEIISRYYFQEGRSIYNLRDNSDLNKAKEILNNLDEYHRILKGTK